jgi:hypothetical protein
VPLGKSMMITAENTYRSKIGLPTLFEDPFKPIQHSHFYELVHGGVRNPLFEWETKFGNHERAC